MLHHAALVHHAAEDGVLAEGRASRFAGHALGQAVGRVGDGKLRRYARARVLDVVVREHARYLGVHAAARGAEQRVVDLAEGVIHAERDLHTAAPMLVTLLY